MRRINHREVARFFVGHSEEHRLIHIESSVFSDGRARILALVNGSPKTRIVVDSDEQVDRFTQIYRSSCQTAQPADYHI